MEAGAKDHQNTSHSADIIEDFLEYFCLKVCLLGADCNWLFNVDKTKVLFSQEPVFFSAK
jgi:hypothetical protein